MSTTEGVNTEVSAMEGVESYQNEDILSETFKVPQPLQSKETLDCSLPEANEKTPVDVKKDMEADTPQVAKKETKNRVEVPLPYTEPSWSSVPLPNHSFEIIKNGTVVDNYVIKNSLTVFGRLDVCDIIFEHPSVSRYHAVVQYCEGDSTHPKGFYLYDLGSTHGTFINKDKATPKIYYKLKVGYVLKFGGSSRLHIFQGPEEVEEEEKVVASKTGEDVCTWGMGDDAEEEEDLSENPFALSTSNEELYIDDPKKTLRGWFEREGYELEYDVEEKGFKTFSCRIQLPIDTPTGEYMPVEASVTGKKKEAVIACALEACRTLDRLGLLRQSHQESRQRKKKKWEENDYYDSDEDTFLDRTGTIEKKREMRMRAEKKAEAETFESIDTKLKAVTEEINGIMKKLSDKKSNNKTEDSADGDTLEAYMSSLSDSKEMASDKIERRKLRYKLQEAEKEKAHLERLMNIVRPTKLPALVKHPGMIGKRIKSKLKLPSSKTEEISSLPSKSNDVEEEEEEESDSESTETKKTEDANTSKKISSSHDESNECKSKSYGLILTTEKKPNTDKEAKKGSEQTESFCETDVLSKKRVFSCQKPQTVENTELSDISPSKKKRKNKPVQQNVDVYTTGNEDYTTWVPPAGQSGDGITHLNAKYGY